ncbi:MAG: hypothetical protein IPH13_11635 [Planctomycetes bacterium]|nr:hypothetical protein [Planctomycetota bacterium]
MKRPDKHDPKRKPPTVLPPAAADSAVVEPLATVAAEIAGIAPVPPVPPVPPTPPLGNTAVIVVHGIGQQLPFETLDAFAHGLTRDDPLATNAVRLARVGTRDLPRVEVALTRGLPKPRELHLYEAYWAPLTEGKVTLRDVFAFLCLAAWDGFWNTKGGRFMRFMFGRVVDLAASRGTRWHLAIAGLVVLALGVLNATATALFASTIVDANGSGFFDAVVVAELTKIGAACVALALLFAGSMIVTRQLVLLFGVLGALIGGAVAIGVAAVMHASGEGPLVPIDVLPWLGTNLAVAVFWTVLVVASAYVRRLLVQFIGDIAAYITPQYVDRFLEVRTQIKNAVREVVEAVYRQREEGRPAYDRILLVGHSLGSVAAYDALNAMLNADKLDPDQAVAVLDRTKLLLTFGSPLDKTAFIFTTRGRDSGTVREALAAAVQPMIQHESYRTIPWINVHSKQDIVSGALDFYDDPAWPGGSPLRVRNVEDPDAKTPLVAHVEYWSNDCVYQQVRPYLA